MKQLGKHGKIKRWKNTTELQLIEREEPTYNPQEFQKERKKRVGQTQYQNGNGWAQYKLKMDIRLESEVVH
jgi:hypothetical protein